MHPAWGAGNRDLCCCAFHIPQHKTYFASSNFVYRRSWRVQRCFQPERPHLCVLPQCADAEVLASWLWTCCCLTCEGWRQCLRCSYTITWDCARWGGWACHGWDNDAGHVAFKPFTVSVDISALPFVFCRCRGAATWRKVDRCEWYDSNVFKC